MIYRNMRRTRKTFQVTMPSAKIFTLICLSLIVACSNELNNTDDGDSKAALTQKEHTVSKEQLETLLRDRYGSVEPLPSIWNGSRQAAQGQYRYRLPDGREIAIDGLANDESGYFVDPEFDLASLPEP